MISSKSELVLLHLRKLKPICINQNPLTPPFSSSLKILTSALCVSTASSPHQLGKFKSVFDSYKYVRNPVAPAIHDSWHACRKFCRLFWTLVVCHTVLSLAKLYYYPVSSIKFPLLSTLFYSLFAAETENRSSHQNLPTNLMRKRWNREKLTKYHRWSVSILLLSMFKISIWKALNIVHETDGN